MTSPARYQHQRWTQTARGRALRGVLSAPISAVVDDQLQNSPGTAGGGISHRPGCYPTGRRFGVGTFGRFAQIVRFVRFVSFSRRVSSLLPDPANSGVERCPALRRSFIPSAIGSSRRAQSTPHQQSCQVAVAVVVHRLCLSYRCSRAGSKNASKRGHDLGKVIQPRGTIVQGSAPND